MGMNPENPQQQQEQHHHLPPPPQPLLLNPSSSSSSSSSSSLKTRFALRFLQSLKKLRTQQQNPRSTIPSQPQKGGGAITPRRRSYGRRIKLAADASMASLIGTRRVWSRALIFNLSRRRGRRRRPQIPSNTTHHHAPTPTVSLIMRSAAAAAKKKTLKNKRTPPNPILPRRLGKKKVLVGVRENHLRKLVPGGNAMDACTLFDETAHYIQCLATQVMVMRNIVDYYSSSSSSTTTSSPSPP